MLVVIGSLVLSIFFTIINIKEYVNSGTVTSINTTTASLNDITFPSLILCNVNQVTASFLWKLDIQDTDDHKKKILFNQFLDGIPDDFNTTQKEKDDLQQLLDKLKNDFGWSDKKPFYKIASQNCRYAGI